MPARFPLASRTWVSQLPQLGADSAKFLACVELRRPIADVIAGVRLMDHVTLVDQQAKCGKRRVDGGAEIDGQRPHRRKRRAYRIRAGLDR